METSRHFYSANHEAQSVGPAAYCFLGETIGKTDKNWLSIDHISNFLCIHKRLQYLRPYNWACLDVNFTVSSNIRNLDQLSR